MMDTLKIIESDMKSITQQISEWGLIGNELDSHLAEIRSSVTEQFIQFIIQADKFRELQASRVSDSAETRNDATYYEVEANSSDSLGEPTSDESCIPLDTLSNTLSIPMEKLVVTHDPEHQKVGNGSDVSSDGEYAKVDSTEVRVKVEEADGGAMDGATGNESSTDTDDDEDSDSEQDILYCFCNKPSFGKMIACDNKACPIEWFHFACVGVKKVPKAEWFCPACRDE